MRYKKSLVVLTILLITASSVLAMEYAEYPFPPRTMTASAVNKITGKNWIEGTVQSTNQWHSELPSRTTQVWYAKNQLSADSLLLTIIQSNNESNAKMVFNDWFAYGVGAPPIYNVTQIGSISYNYTVIDINLSGEYPLFSELRAIYGNEVIIFETSEFFVLNKSVMLNLLTSQVALINQSSSFLPN